MEKVILEGSWRNHVFFSCGFQCEAHDLEPNSIGFLITRKMSVSIQFFVYSTKVLSEYSFVIRLQLFQKWLHVVSIEQSWNSWSSGTECLTLAIDCLFMMGARACTRPENCHLTAENSKLVFLMRMMVAILAGLINISSHFFRFFVVADSLQKSCCCHYIIMSFASGMYCFTDSILLQTGRLSSCQSAPWKSLRLSFCRQTYVHVLYPSWRVVCDIQT